ncbi:hypothetical protein LPC13_05245 [Clostridium celatum]|uniref:hypothetical protein n=1 Tax=Clostridium celatum TaxID=36834 RepID=UPI001F3D77EF|nr:hypothetical protein [Clostridium celatum]MCE9654681.1 hypothetical protein [Clostridium celatum]
MKEYKFRVGVPPTKDTINRCNICAAQILLDKYGVDVMRKVYKARQLLKKKNDNN